MGRIKNIKGEKFGKYTVIERAQNKKDGTARWLCKCDCGNYRIVDGTTLRNGKSKSCGCLRRDISSAHGLSDTRLYFIWNNMKNRCLNENSHHFNNYGARGIKICDEWQLNFMSFYNWSMKNGYSNNLTIDRIDNNGNYEPSNCRWTTAKVQANNRRSNNTVEFNGNKYTLSELSELTFVPYDTLKSRLKLGWNIKDAMTVVPVIGTNQYK